MLLLHTVVINDRPVFQIYGSTEPEYPLRTPWTIEAFARYDATEKVWRSPAVQQAMEAAGPAARIADIEVLPAQLAVKRYGAVAGDLPLMHELPPAELDRRVGDAVAGRDA